MSQTLTGRIKPHLSMGYKDESRRQSLGLSNKALIIPMYIREPDKIGFEPMVLPPLQQSCRDTFVFMEELSPMNISCIYYVIFI